VVDKKNVIVGEDRTATSYNIAKKELKQNAHFKWRMFSATLTSSVKVPAAGSESKGIAMFGAIDNTLYFRIEANNTPYVIGAQLHLGKQGKNGNVIADLLKFSTHASTTQGIIIIKGSITDSSLSGPLEGQSINNLVKLIEENKVYVRISASRDGDLAGSLHLAGKQPSLS